MSHLLGIVIPTYMGALHLPHCLPPLLESSLRPRILIIDSSSTDETLLVAQQFAVESVVIPKERFNHGNTREWGRKYLQTAYVVMMTQDAYLKEPEALEKLLTPLFEKKASLSYARQLPHKNADRWAAFSRAFNYPDKSYLRSAADISYYGTQAFFCSNSCAAYSNAALDEVGGFPEVLFGEDTIVAAKLLHKGHRLAYVAEAEVFHSHNYSLKQEFCRHFQMAKERHRHLAFVSLKARDFQKGRAYARGLIRSVCRSSPLSLPYAYLHLIAKWSGFRLGAACTFFTKNGT